MDDTAAALMRFQSETNGRLTDFANAMSKLSENVATLAGTMQSQIASSVGFKELYEMQVKQLERADSSIADILTTKVSAVERVEKALEKLQHEVQGMKTFSQAVTSAHERLLKLEAANPAAISERVLALEAHRLAVQNQVRGARLVIKIFWVFGGIVCSAISSLITWYIMK